MNAFVEPRASNDSVSRPDTEQSNRIEEALSMHGYLGLNAAIAYLEHHAIGTETMLRVLMLPRKRRKLASSVRSRQASRSAQSTEQALDAALAASFPASDPVAIAISRVDARAGESGH